MWSSPHERVVLEQRRHGIVLVRPFTRALALSGLGATLSWLAGPLTIPGALLLAAGAAVAVRAAWAWERTRFVVTTEKLYVSYGYFRRRAAAVRLTRAGAIEIEQSLLGRLLGYGTVIAILREPEPISGAQPHHRIERGDTLVTVGKAGDYPAFRRLLAAGEAA